MSTENKDIEKDIKRKEIKGSHEEPKANKAEQDISDIAIKYLEFSDDAPGDEKPMAGHKKDENPGQKKTDTKQGAGFGFADFVTYVGECVGSAFAAVVAFVLSFVKAFLRVIKKAVHLVYTAVDNFVISSLKSFNEEWSFFRTEVKSARAKIRDTVRKSPLAVFSVLKHYVGVAFKRHPHMFARMADVVLPVIGFAILVGTINHWSSSTFALKVSSGGQNIGYVESEAVYIEAQNKVKERFNADADSEETADLKAKYTVVTVQPNELTDAETISDSIVENTKGDSVFACGVYIDDDFICALKSETDAMQVFNNIIDEYEVEDENDVVGFVEDVQYVQGLYTDDVIWNSEKLAQKLKTKKSEAKYYTVQTGDTLSQIANANGLKTSELLELNPDMGDTIKVGDQVLVSHEVNYVRLKVVKTEVTREEIAYKTVKNNNSKLYKGTTKVKQKGIKGIDEVTSLVTYIDGVRVSSQEIGRVTIQNPRDEIIDVGTKRVSTYGGGYTPSRYVKGSGSLIWPAVGCGTITSRFGYRTLRGRPNFHGGVDIAGGNARGKTVVAAASGRVTAAGWGGAYGYRVIIDHGNGMSTLYAHMLAGSLCVGSGQYVSGGSAIGKVGSTGNSTGPHLHFEVRINGNKVNPAPYIGA